MKVIVNRNSLREALATVAPAVAVKPSTPVTACVLLKTTNTTTLEITATNLTTEIATHIPCSVEEEGAAAIVGKTIGAIVQKLAGEIVTITATAATATLKSEAATFELPTFDAADFPETTNFTPTATFKAPATTFSNLARRVAFAAAKNDDRPALEGIFIVTKNGRLYATASDCRRVAIDSAPLDAPETSFVAPAAAILNIKNTTPTTFEIGQNVFAATSQHARVVSRLIDAKFPEVDKAIPKTFKTTADLETAELARALKRLEIIARANEYKAVALTFNDDGLTLTATANTTGTATEHVDAQVTGADLRIAFNITYLSEVLSVLNARACTFAMNDPLTAAKITGDANDPFIYVVTPLRG